MMTLKQWLAKYGQEDCSGCEYNQPAKAHCLYKGKNYCVRYERMARDLREETEK